MLSTLQTVSKLFRMPAEYSEGETSWYEKKRYIQILFCQNVQFNMRDTMNEDMSEIYNFENLKFSVEVVYDDLCSIQPCAVVSIQQYSYFPISHIVNKGYLVPLLKIPKTKLWIDISLLLENKHIL